MPAALALMIGNPIALPFLDMANLLVVVSQTGERYESLS